MPFELPTVTRLTCTNANPRTERHGEDLVRAIDLTFEVGGENTLLDAIAPGLRVHHYCNRAADAHQVELPDIPVPLPNLRFPQLPTEHVRWNQPKARGYRWIWDWGRDAQHVDLTDVVLASLSYTLHEGGSVDAKFTISYNGDELNDNTLYGELCGLAAMGEISIELFAPRELVPVKKGYRAGRTDTPQASAQHPAQGDLVDEDLDDDDETFPEGSPEAAFASAIPAPTDSAAAP